MYIYVYVFLKYLKKTLKLFYHCYPCKASISVFFFFFYWLFVTYTVSFQFVQFEQAICGCGPGRPKMINSYHLRKQLCLGKTFRNREIFKNKISHFWTYNRQIENLLNGRLQFLFDVCHKQWKDKKFCSNFSPFHYCSTHDFYTNPRHCIIVITRYV